MENACRDYQPLVSIIIPCKEIDYNTQHCITHCKLLNYPNKEIIVITDKECPGLPAEKRNWAMDRAKGEIYAFIDSDAYPPPNWLNIAVYYLQIFDGVCGPGILPPDSGMLEQATDLVYRMLPYSYRVTEKNPRFVKEFPSFNLVVNKTDLRFQPYLTGEDTLFCRELNELFYHPSIKVYHRRRPLFKPYWKQIATYGWHRGHLIRLALMGWLSTWVVYPFNFIKGFFAKPPRDKEDGELW